MSLKEIVPQKYLRNYLRSNQRAFDLYESIGEMFDLLKVKIDNLKDIADVTKVTEGFTDKLADRYGLLVQNYIKDDNTILKQQLEAINWMKLIGTAWGVREAIRINNYKVQIFNLFTDDYQDFIRISVNEDENVFSYTLDSGYTLDDDPLVELLSFFYLSPHFDAQILLDIIQNKKWLNEVGTNEFNPKYVVNEELIIAREYVTEELISESGFILDQSVIVIPKIITVPIYDISLPNTLKVQGNYYIQDWNILTSYSVGESVVYNNVYYICTKANIGKNPETETVYWRVSESSYSMMIGHYLSIQGSDDNDNFYKITGLNYSPITGLTTITLEETLISDTVNGNIIFGENLVKSNNPNILSGQFYVETSKIDSVSGLLTSARTRLLFNSNDYGKNALIKYETYPMTFIGDIYSNIQEYINNEIKPVEAVPHYFTKLSVEGNESSLQTVDTVKRIIFQLTSDYSPSTDPGYVQMLSKISYIRFGTGLKFPDILSPITPSQMGNPVGEKIFLSQGNIIAGDMSHILISGSNKISNPFIVGATLSNTDNGKLYGRITISSSDLTLTLYKDSGRTLQVATGDTPTTETIWEKQTASIQLNMAGDRNYLFCTNLDNASIYLFDSLTGTYINQFNYLGVTNSDIKTKKESKPFISGKNTGPMLIPDYNKIWLAYYDEDLDDINLIWQIATPWAASPGTVHLVANSYYFNEDISESALASTGGGANVMYVVTGTTIRFVTLGSGSVIYSFDLTTVPGYSDVTSIDSIDSCWDEGSNSEFVFLSVTITSGPSQFYTVLRYKNAFSSRIDKFPPPFPGKCGIRVNKETNHIYVMPASSSYIRVYDLDLNQIAEYTTATPSPYSQTGFFTSHLNQFFFSGTGITDGGLFKLKLSMEGPMSAFASGDISAMFDINQPIEEDFEADNCIVDGDETLIINPPTIKENDMYDLQDNEYPANINNRKLTEIGLFDDDDKLLAVASFPQMIKTDKFSLETTLRINLEV